jgi:hypothetical protein
MAEVPDAVSWRIVMGGRERQITMVEKYQAGDLLGAPMRKMSTTMIRKFGANFTLRKFPPAIFQAANDRVQVSPIDFPVRGVVTPYTARQVNGQTINAGDVRVLIAASDLGSTEDVMYALSVRGA